VSSCHGHPEEQGEAVRAMRGRVDGLLVMSPFVDDAGLLRDCLSPALPAVFVNSQLSGWAIARSASITTVAPAR
jgi:LacI family transcriptional regulator